MPHNGPSQATQNATSGFPAAIRQAAATAPGTVSCTPHTIAVHADTSRWLPAGSVDLVLTDPPYNIARDTNFHTYAGNTINSYRFDADKGWDSYSHDAFQTLLHHWADEIARVLRTGGTFAVFCADAYLSHLMDALTATGLKVRRTLTWRKPNAMPVNRSTMMMSACEYVVVGVKGSNATFRADLPLDDLCELVDIEQVLVADKAAAIVDKHVRRAVAALTATGDARPQQVGAAVAEAVRDAAEQAEEKVAAMYAELPDGSPGLRACIPNHVAFPSKGGTRLHPTEKPVPLLRYLTSLLSNPGDVVLDMFAGSGSTGQAAAALGRYVVLVERDVEFYDRMRRRLGEVDTSSSGDP